MEYTKNYHLPQWVKEDRIMMDDFNDAMARLENGLTSVSGESGEASAGLAEIRRLTEEKLQTVRSEGSEALYQGLRRLARNHYQALSRETRLPWQNGVFRQQFTDDKLPAGAAGLKLMGSQAWVMGQSENVTGKGFFDSITSLSPLVISTNGLSACRPFIMVFTAPGSGVLDSFYINGSFNSAQEPLKLRATMRCLDTGEEVAVWEYSSPVESFSGTDGMNVRIGGSFHTGFRYRIEIVTLNAGRNCSLSFNQTFAEPHISISPQAPVGPGTLTYNLTGQEENRGGLVIARYQSCGTGGNFSLLWNGKTLAPAAVRAITGPNGEALHEAEFQYKEPVPASSTLKLAVTANDGGEVGLCDWGAVLV